VVVVLDDGEEEEEGDGDPPRDGIGGSGFNDDESDSIDVSVQRKERGRRRRMAVVLGSDTRATAGSLVADKNASKIHSLASNLYACGAGTSADLLHLARQARYTLRYVRQCQFESVGNPNATTYARRGSNGDDPDGDGNDCGDDDPDVFVNVPAACRWLQDTLYSRGGSCQANLIVGGVTEEGDAVLRAIHPHGSMDEDLPYAALGSGGLAAMSVLESRYRPRMGLEEAVRLVKDAVAAGIRNDLGSGSAIDLCVLDSRAPPSAPAAHTRSAVPEEDPYPPRRPEPRVNELPRDSPPHAGGASGESTEIRAGMLEGQDESETGVNGFGNVPIRIRSVRTVQRFGEEERLASDWDEILGLSPPPTE
jgi:20S proteasome subunit beta 2